MILYDLLGTEDNEIYQELEISNGIRHYDFLRSIVEASLSAEKPYLSSQVIKSLNFHAIACLHTNAGEFRPCEVHVSEDDGNGNKVKKFEPPRYFQVQPLMDDLVNQINRIWEKSDPILLSAYVLWRLCYIHPFINGNGRTARASCYFVLCVAFGKWLPGKKILPELIRNNHNEYVAALREVDKSLGTGKLDLSALHAFLLELLKQQIESAQEESEEAAPEKPKLD